MGRLFAKELSKEGHEITITGPRPEKGEAVAKELDVTYLRDNKEAVKGADITIVTVPIAKTPEILNEVMGAVDEGSVIADLTSVKEDVCKELEKAPCEVVSIHPVFGPSVPDFGEQNFILCPVKGKKWLPRIEELLRGKGAKTVVCSPKEHDKIMGVVQGLSHFMLISAGIALDKLDFNVEDSRRYSSPVYRLITDLIGRILEQDPKLYAEIQLGNKEAEKARTAFMESCEELYKLIREENEDEFVAKMKKAAENFGDTKSALKRTDELLR